mmetsp:Transcript_5391/g.15844  ORF Transcript_5391/g.15844 Transcript_5391/m.15844 type:complete len:304 (+) Transcript_5391:1111-2022(+)
MLHSLCLMTTWSCLQASNTASPHLNSEAPTARVFASRGPRTPACFRSFQPSTTCLLHSLRGIHPHASRPPRQHLRQRLQNLPQRQLRHQWQFLLTRRPGRPLHRLHRQPHRPRQTSLLQRRCHPRQRRRLPHLPRPSLLLRHWSRVPPSRRRRAPRSLRLLASHLPRKSGPPLGHGARPGTSPALEPTTSPSRRRAAGPRLSSQAQQHDVAPPTGPLPAPLVAPPPPPQWVPARLAAQQLPLDALETNLHHRKPRPPGPLEPGRRNPHRHRRWETTWPSHPWRPWRQPSPTALVRAPTRARQP